MTELREQFLFLIFLSPIVSCGYCDKWPPGGENFKLHRGFTQETLLNGMVGQELRGFQINQFFRCYEG